MHKDECARIVADFGAIGVAARSGGQDAFLCECKLMWIEELDSGEFAGSKQLDSIECGTAPVRDR